MHTRDLSLFSYAPLFVLLVQASLPSVVLLLREDVGWEIDGSLSNCGLSKNGWNSIWLQFHSLLQTKFFMALSCNLEQNVCTDLSLGPFQFNLVL